MKMKMKAQQPVARSSVHNMMLNKTCDDNMLTPQATCLNLCYLRFSFLFGLVFLFCFSNKALYSYFIALLSILCIKCVCMIVQYNVVHVSHRIHVLSSIYSLPIYSTRIIHKSVTIHTKYMYENV